jgi:hypothetical protein
MTKFILRSSTSLMLVMALVFVSLAAKCDGNKYSPYVKTGVRGLVTAEKIFAANGLSTAKFDPAIKIGNAAVTGLDSGATNALDRVADFIDAFESITADAELIKDQNTRTLVLVGMAVGSEALHELADQLKKDAVGSQDSEAGSRPAKARTAVAIAAESNGGRRMAAFAAKPRWRCRNSINGQFAQMTFCKEHPDTSTVERF